MEDKLGKIIDKLLEENEKIQKCRFFSKEFKDGYHRRTKDAIIVVKKLLREQN